MFAKTRLSAPAKGFTLVEVMIALAIVSLALPALIVLVMAQIDGAAHIRNKTYGMWVAENELTRLTLLNNKDLFPTYKLMSKDSGRTEMMGLEWQWRFETVPAEEIPVKGIVKMDVDVVILGLSGGGSYGVKDMEKADPIAHLTGYMSE